MIRSWILWSVLGVVSLIILSVMAWFFREKIRGWYYRIKYPTRVYQLVIIYPSNMMVKVWRLPDEKGIFDFKNQTYLFNEEKIIRMRRSWSTLFYIYNKPEPISFDFSKGKAEITSAELTEFRKSNLITKLLTAGLEDNLLKIIMLIVCGIAGGMLYVIYLLMDIAK